MAQVQVQLIIRTKWWFALAFYPAMAFLLLAWLLLFEDEFDAMESRVSRWLSEVAFIAEAR